MVEMYNPQRENMEKEEIHKRFLEFDKSDEHYYNAICIDECKFVIKFPLFEEDGFKPLPKIEEFNLSNIIFLTSY